MLKIQTEQFSGPLDLLLRLIEDEKLDITTVNLAKVTDEYLAKVRALEAGLGLNELADFLEIAARLVFIKSKYLLPQFQLSEDERLSAIDLELRLREYQRFRKAGEYLRSLIGGRNRSYEREVYWETRRSFCPPPAGISARDLRSVLTDFFAEQGTLVLPLSEKIIESRVSLEEKVAILRDTIKTCLEFCLHHVYNAADRTDMVVTFLALLELLKQKAVSVDQNELFGEIKVKTLVND